MNTLVITGTNQGIGLATAQLFLENGWRVIGTYRKALPPIDSPNFTPVALDLTKPKSIVKATKVISKFTHRIDALVNNSGVLLDAFDEIPDPNKIRQTFEVNVFGAIDFTEHLLALVPKVGTITNVSSRMGSQSAPIDDETAVGYRMSKAALNMYTRSLAFRLKSKRIVVSAIHPGWVNTSMGNSIATAKAKPNCEPEDAAKDIFTLVTTNTKSGLLWRHGKRMEW